MSSDGDEMKALVLDDCADKMQKAVAHLQAEFAALRTGRASSALVEKLRMVWPSFEGLTPRSLCWIAFSIALIVPLSYGEMVRTRGSGTPKPASCWSGTSLPYASTRSFSTSPDDARPVRSAANSAWTCATAFFILSSHSSRTSAFISSPSELTEPPPN